MPPRRFTARELRRYSGREGAPTFIAYRGLVYDVSHSFLWQHGSHQALHVAGGDLTNSLDAAPHDGHVLERFPMVGLLDVD